MRGSNDRRGRFASFFVGIGFCLIGIFMLIYISKDMIVDAIKESADSDHNQTSEQTLPIESNDGAVVQNSNEPALQRLDQPTNGAMLPSTGQDQDRSIALPPRGQLAEVHGQGGRAHLRSIPNQYTNKDELVHQNAYPALMTLISAAKQDGIELSIVSAYRSYDHQRRIWENKWGNVSDTDTQKARNILRYSSFPGTSRHHWGSDIDFNSVALDYWRSATGRNIHRWLTNNAPKFGFCQVYASGRNKGYSDEPWHWSHMPTASYYYNQISSPQVLQTALSQPLKGASAVRQIPDHMMGYITGVSGCRVSAQPATPNRVVTAAAPQKNNRKPQQPLNNDAFNEVHLEAVNNTQGSHNKQNNIPKPDLPPDTVVESPPSVPQSSLGETTNGKSIQIRTDKGGVAMITNAPTPNPE